MPAEVYNSLMVKELIIGDISHISGATAVVKKGTIGMSGAQLMYYNGTAWRHVTDTAV